MDDIAAHQVSAAPTPYGASEHRERSAEVPIGVADAVTPGTTNSSSSVTAASSIFQFQPPPVLQPKKAETPRKITPRNLVLPEPTDINAALPTAPECIYSAPRDDSDDEVHRHSKQPQSEHKHKHKLPPSTRKYLSPRQDSGDSEAPGKVSVGQERSVQQSHRPLAVRVPRSLRGKIQFYSLRVLQRAKYSTRAMHFLHRQLPFRQKAAYVLILAGLFSESATPAPRYNVPIGILVFMRSTSRFDHHVVVSGLCLAIIIDLVWLLRPQEGSFNGYFLVKYTNYMLACLGICTLLKICLVFSTYSDLGPEPLSSSEQQQQQPARGSSDPHQLPPPPPPRQHHAIWQHIKYFFPRKTYPRCSHLSFEVLMRTLALIWIHGLCGVALLMLGLLSAMFYSGTVQFRSSTLGVPLHLMMLIRSTTTLASYVVATQHMSYSGCLRLFGCHKIAEIGERDDDNGGGSDIVLKYNKRWLRRVQRAKALDVLAGIYFVLVYYAAFHSGQFFAGNGLTAVLVITGLVVLVLDLWAPLLIMVVAKCATVLHAHHRRGTVDVDPYYPNQLEWEENEDELDDRKGGSASDSDAPSSCRGRSNDDSSSPSSSNNSKSSSSGYSTTASQIHRRRRRRLRRRERMEEKRQKRALSRGHSSSSGSRKPLLEPPKRQNTVPIIDVHDVLSSRTPDSGRQQPLSSRPLTSLLKPSHIGVWVRHWHDASGRSYLVHSVTGETVWEMTGSKSESGNLKMSERKTPRSAEMASSRSALASAHRRGSSDRSVVPSNTNDRVVRERPSSPPTSDSEVIVITSPRPGLSSSGRLSARLTSLTASEAHGNDTGRDVEDTAINEQRLTPNEFHLLWDALPNGGAFICRVSRIPNVLELTRHLVRNRFVVVSDALNDEGLRVVHFYAPVVAPPEVDERFTSSGRLSARTQQQFFLGEFVFDSRSLKLFATFRCPRPEAIVSFVRRLQLKEIVGSYAPCD